jgi:hypothetical protein
MSNGPPEERSEDARQGAGQDTRVLHIDNLHLHANEIDSLRRLAKTDPELAKLIVEQKDRFDRREHASFRFGLVVSGSLALATLIATSFIFVYLGLLASISLVVVILALALFIRVLLTGEWSETSWIGGVIKSIIRSLGGTPPD